jgi:hypothetical protein
MDTGVHPRNFRAWIAKYMQWSQADGRRSKPIAIVGMRDRTYGPDIKCPDQNQATWLGYYR